VAAVLIAGAGIGGLTAALVLARHAFRVELFEASERLEEIGAGIQLSPNAARILIGLGLAERLEEHVVVPEELRVRMARTGEVLARAPLGATAQAQYGAPYWVIHRGDLQAVLRDAAIAAPGIALQLGARVNDFAALDDGIAVGASRRKESVEARGVLLVCADGLLSSLRKRLGHRKEPRSAGHSAWRALIPAAAAPPEFSEPAINLWLGHSAHLVHYPVKSGTLINVVAIARDTWNEPGWNEPGWNAPVAGRGVLDRFGAGRWHASARALLDAAENWHKWALFDCAPFSSWGKGRVTLLGDAAHPTLPYLAQGAAMAIEDAAVLGDCLAHSRNDAAAALRAYESIRRPRTARVQRASRRNATVYHLGGAEPLLRAVTRFALHGDKVVRRYDWLYGWKL
jgi:salicylate hydroxylase